MPKNRSPINALEVDPNRFPRGRVGEIKWEKEVNEQEESNQDPPTPEEQEQSERESRYD